MKTNHFLLRLIAIAILLTSFLPIRPAAAQASILPLDSWIAVIGLDGNVYLLHPDGSGLRQATDDANYRVSYAGLNWSPDGEKLGFSRREENGGVAIYILDLNNPSPSKLPVATSGGFDWYSDSQRIIYDSPASLNSTGQSPRWTSIDGLYAYDIAGGDSQLVLPVGVEGKPPLSPELSADDRYVMVMWAPARLDSVGPGYSIHELASGVEIQRCYNCYWSNAGSLMAEIQPEGFGDQPTGIWVEEPGDAPTPLTWALSQYYYGSAAIWSPDNRLVAVEDKNGGIELVPTSPGDSKVISQGRPLDFSPDVDALLVYRPEPFPAEGGKIAILGMDGAQLADLGVYRSADWQPRPQASSTAGQGEWIAFTALDGSVSLIHPDGSGLHAVTPPLTGANANYLNLKWSPDGKLLAFSLFDYDAGMASIWLYWPDSGDLQKIIDGSQGGFDWYPDGAAILFDKFAQQSEVVGPNATCPGEYLSSGPYPYDGLYRYNLLDGSQERVIAPQSPYPLSNPDLSPDGASVTFQQPASAMVMVNYPHYVTSLASPGQAYPLDGVFGACSWSPDSQTIACGMYDDPCSIANSCPITLFSTQGKETARLPGAERSFDLRPIWSPSGDELVFNASYELFFADGPCGGGSGPNDDASISTTMFSRPADGSQSPLSEGSPLDWSPDGRQVLILRGSDMFGVTQIYTQDRDGGEAVYLADGRLAAWQPAAGVRASELRVMPAEAAEIDNAITLVWSIPKSAAGEGKPPVEYDIRFAAEPVTDANWDGATQMDGEPVTDQPGEQQGWTVVDSRLALGQAWYFGMKARAQGGEWSPVVSSPAFIDSGFRTNFEGFNVRNGPLGCAPEPTGWGVFPNPPADGDFTLEDTYRMFGMSACLIPSLSGQGCEVYWPTLGRWVRDVNQATRAGHCVGFSTASLNLMREPGRVSLPTSNWQVAYQDLALDDLRREITFYHALQFADPVFSLREYIYKTIVPDLPATLEAIRSGLQPGGDPVEVEFSVDGTWHSVLPVAMTEAGPGAWRIYVYDSNCPRSEDYCAAQGPVDCQGLFRITIDPQSNQWFYGDRGFDYGILNRSSNLLYAIPISLFNGGHTLPFEDSYLIWIAGGAGGALIQDEQGRRIGTIDGALVNEIPGAAAAPVNGGVGAAEPVYALPTGAAYETILDGSRLAELLSYSVSQYGKGFAVAVEDFQLLPGTRDILEVSPDGGQIRYTSGAAKEASFSLARDGDSTGSLFAVRGADLAAGETATLNHDLPAWQFTYANASTAGSYDVEIHKITADGERVFTYTDLPIEPGAAHTFDLSGWNGKGKATLLVDEDNDGEAEQELRLKNGGAGAPSTASSALVVGGLVFIAGLALFLVGTVRYFKLSRFGR